MRRGGPCPFFQGALCTGPGKCGQAVAGMCFPHTCRPRQQASCTRPLAQPVARRLLILRVRVVNMTVSPDADTERAGEGDVSITIKGHTAAQMLGRGDAKVRELEELVRSLGQRLET